MSLEDDSWPPDADKPVLRVLRPRAFKVAIMTLEYIFPSINALIQRFKISCTVNERGDHARNKVQEVGVVNNEENHFNNRDEGGDGAGLDGVVNELRDDRVGLLPGSLLPIMGQLPYIR